MNRYWYVTKQKTEEKIVDGEIKKITTKKWSSIDTSEDIDDSHLSKAKQKLRAELKQRRLDNIERQIEDHQNVQKIKADIAKIQAGKI